MASAGRRNGRKAAVSRVRTRCRTQKGGTSRTADRYFCPLGFPYTDPSPQGMVSWRRKRGRASCRDTIRDRRPLMRCGACHLREVRVNPPSPRRPLARGVFLIALLHTGAAHARVFADRYQDVRQFEKDLTAAVGRNDVGALNRFLSDDWTIVSGEGTLISKDTFLQVMAGGELTHQSMDPVNQTIRLYGGVAVVTAHIQSGGSYRGNFFHTDDISTDVLVKMRGRWVCVLTQLTRVTVPPLP